MILQSELLKSFNAHENNVAIEEAGERVTYADLLVSANKVTKWLLERKVTPGARIGVSLESVSQIVSAIIGIINARCTFILLDERLPEVRLSAMMEELNLECLILSRPSDRASFASV